VGDCRFTPLSNVCSYIMSWRSDIRWNDDFCFVL